MSIEQECQKSLDSLSGSIDSLLEKYAEACRERDEAMAQVEEITKERDDLLAELERAESNA